MTEAQVHPASSASAPEGFLTGQPPNSSNSNGNESSAAGLHDPVNASGILLTPILIDNKFQLIISYYCICRWW